MRYLLKNKLLNKAIYVLLVVMLIFNFCLPTFSYGLDLGGCVAKPVCSLILLIIDGINLPIGLFLGGFSEVYNVLNMHDSVTVLASPEKIFAGEYPILNANLFSAESVNNSTDIENIGGELWNGIGSTTIIPKIRDAVSGIYVILLNMCAVVLLCLLIYTGIRIVLSASMPEEQAKWKGYLIDWIKSLALLLFIHIIMIAIFNMTDLLAKALSNSLDEGNSIIEILHANVLEDYDLVPMIFSLIMYGYCTYLTVIFTFSYFKRVVWTAILIMMAPVVSALYAIGGQGKNIYKSWFKEFLINCLIQPFHVIMFYVLIILPVSIATQANEVKILTLLDITGVGLGEAQNVFMMIYCLIVMSLIRPAEKYFRNMFGLKDGRIANSASFDSGKQLADSITNAIKQTAITAVSVGATLATGGAAAGAAAGGASASAAGASAGASAGATGSAAKVATVSGGESLGLNGAEQAAKVPSTQNAAGMNNVENAEGVANPENAEMPENAKTKGGMDSLQPQQGGGYFGSPSDGIKYKTQGRLDSLVDRLIDRINGKFLDTPEKSKNTFDAMDKLYEWRHMIGDIGKEFGDLEASPGHRPMRMTTFLKERVNNQFAEEEKKLSAIATQFANDGNIIGIYMDRIEKEKGAMLRKRHTRDITDENGDKKPFFDELKYKEEIKQEAIKEAQKTSEFIKYGYMNFSQIDNMRKLGKDANLSSTEDIIRYAENYNAVARSMIKRGDADAESINSPEMKEEIRDRLKFLDYGQNVQGAQIPAKISQTETVVRVDAETLGKLSKINK